MTCVLQYLIALLSLTICFSSSVLIHRMKPDQDDLNVCLNPRYHKMPAGSFKPRVQIKALLYRSPISRTMDAGPNKRTSKASAGVDLHRKIIVIIKFMNRGKMSSEEEYIVVDHVTDQKTKTSYRLLNPLVFKAKQYQIKQMYPLRAVRNVNWDPWEEVINKNTKQFKGCSTDVTRATCGVQYDSNHQLIEYSEGFCCSCDAYVNMNRQPADFSPEYIHLPLDPGDERSKRNADSDNVADLSGAQEKSRSASDTSEFELDEQEQPDSRVMNIFTRRVIVDLKSRNAKNSSPSQIRRKKEIGKFFLDKANQALESIRSKTLHQFGHHLLNNMFNDSQNPKTKSMGDSVKYKRCHSFPNYITIPGFETAYGFTSNDTTRLNTVVDPWDSTLNRGTSTNWQDDERRNRFFFHALGELQSGYLNATHESNTRNSSSSSTENTSISVTHFKRCVTGTCSLQRDVHQNGTQKSSTRKNSGDLTGNIVSSSNESHNERHVLVETQSDRLNGTFGWSAQGNSSFTNTARVLNKTCFKRSVSDTSNIIDLNCRNETTCASLIVKDGSTYSMLNTNSNTIHYSNSFVNDCSALELNTSLANYSLYNPVTQAYVNTSITVGSNVNDTTLFSIECTNQLNVPNETGESSTRENKITNTDTHKSIATIKPNMVFATSSEENVITSIENEVITFKTNSGMLTGTEETTGIVIVDNTLYITDTPIQYKTGTASGENQADSRSNEIRTITLENTDFNKQGILEESTSKNIAVMVNTTNSFESHTIGKIGDDGQNMISKETIEKNNQFDSVTKEIHNTRVNNLKNTLQNVPFCTVNQTLMLENSGVDGHSKILFTHFSNQTISPECFSVKRKKIKLNATINTFLYLTNNQIYSSYVSNEISQNTSKCCEQVHANIVNKNAATVMSSAVTSKTKKRILENSADDSLENLSSSTEHGKVVSSIDNEKPSENVINDTTMTEPVINLTKTLDPIDEHDLALTTSINPTHVTEMSEKCDSFHEDSSLALSRNENYDSSTIDDSPCEREVTHLDKSIVSTETIVKVESGTLAKSIENCVSIEPKIMEPATVANPIEKATESKSSAPQMASTESPGTFLNFSQRMHNLYCLQNMSQVDVLPMRQHYPEDSTVELYEDSIVDKVCENKTSKLGKLKFQIRNRVKGKINNSRNLFELLKPKQNKTVDCDTSKTKTKNFLNSIQHGSLLRSKNSSIHAKCSNLLKSYIERKHARNRNYDKIKSLEVDSKKENVRQYSCQHAWVDTVPAESYLSESPSKNYKIKGSDNIPNDISSSMDSPSRKAPEKYLLESNGSKSTRAPLNDGSVKAPCDTWFSKTACHLANDLNSPKIQTDVKRESFPKNNEGKVPIDSITKAFSDYLKPETLGKDGNISNAQSQTPSTIIADARHYIQISADEINETRFKQDHLQLKPEVMNTLLDLIQDESLIQMYNERKLMANRSLLKTEVDKLEEDTVQNFMKHEVYTNHSSGDDARKLVKRQITSSGIQVRGGQSCVDRIVPSYVSDPDAYHESAHCLRYSDIWYTLYKLGVPFIEHSVEVKVFEKHYVHKIVNHWSQLSKGMSTRLRTSSRHVNNELSKCPKCPSISMNYLPLENNKKGPFSLNPDSVYLLAPQHNCPQCASIQGGPREYMLVPPDDITLEGDVCNKIGVGYRAFTTQPTRCGQPRDTCLDRQISDLWHLDKKAKQANKRGRFFLENFASVSDDAHIVNITTGKEYLGLEYLGSYSSAVEIEIDNHFHTVVKVGESASIAEVHIDATCKLHTKLGVLVTNQGLTSGLFRVNLTDCPVEIARQCARVETSPVTIHPQHRHVFRITLNEDLPLDRFFVSVLVTNAKQRRVAARKIQVQKLDRCFCIQYCECACTGSMSGLQCSPLSVQDYHDAGFIGSLPEDSDPRCDDYRHLLSSVFSSAPNSNPWIYLAVHLAVVFLLMGLAKAIVGVCCLDYVSNYGVWMLVSEEAKKMTAYKEPELHGERVICDEIGYPVHPKYLTRSIRYVPQPKQFLLNIFFYILLLLVVIKKVTFHYLYLIFDLLGCCCKPFIHQKRNDQDRMRGGGEDDDEIEEAEDYIRNANKEVLEKLYSGRDDDDSPTSCCAVYSDGGLDLYSYKMGLQQDVLSEPSRKN